MLRRERRAETVGRTTVDLYPGYFALVMATGIVSIAGHLLGMAPVAWLLFGITIVAYVVLWLLTGIRLARYFPRVVADLRDHSRGAGFFTIVAATCVLGRQVELLTGNSSVATLLWCVGVVLWLGLMYAFLSAVMMGESKPGLESGLNGGWLMIVVATQSVSVLGMLVADHFAGWRDTMLFLTLALYLLGCMLYVLLIALIFYRLTFFPVTPDALTPLYWINMGAVAITTLAGATLLLKRGEWRLLEELGPFLEGFTLLFWVTGTWWIPLLVILGLWRHAWKRVPLTYDPQYWGLVFPLGMYTASTFQLGKATGVPILFAIPHYFIYAALLAWALTFAGLLRWLVSGVIGAPLAAQPYHR